jgi:glycosyltransferase involved in cell wall biosynthesis
MRVAIDASATAKRERTGVSRYATSLLDAVFELSERPEITLAYRLSRFRRSRFRYRPPLPRDARERWFQDGVAGLLIGACDVFHGLDARLPRGVEVPLVATLHDVGAVEHAAIASARFRDRKLTAFEDLAERATRIVCVSRATADAYARLFPVAAERLAVVHHGVDPRFVKPTAEVREELRARLALPPRFLLFVGLISTRKNLVNLVRAFDRVAATRRDLHLVLAGGAAHGFDDIAAAISGSASRDRVRLPGFIADADLPALYSLAELFVFPGLVEGFGLPLLEAMACGTPALAADRPVSREVAADVAHLADCEDDAALAAAIDAALDESPRERRVVEGIARAATFTWAEAARRTVRIWHEAAAQGEP